MEHFREEVVQKFVDALREDRAPFQTGKVQGEVEVRPFSAASNKPYYGTNGLVLQMRANEEGYADPRWLTFKQASDRGYQVRDGETGVALEIWSRFRDEPQVNGDGEYIRDDAGNIRPRVELSRPQVSYITVFNGEQIDGIPEYNRHAELTLARTRQRLSRTSWTRPT